MYCNCEKLKCTWQQTLSILVINQDSATVESNSFVKDSVNTGASFHHCYWVNHLNLFSNAYKNWSTFRIDTSLFINIFL